MLITGFSTLGSSDNDHLLFIYPQSDFAFRLHIQSILDNNRAMICTTVQIEFSLENNEDNYKNKTITKSYVGETKFLRTMIAKATRRSE